MEPPAVGAHQRRDNRSCQPQANHDPPRRRFTFLPLSRPFPQPSSAHQIRTARPGRRTTAHTATARRRRAPAYRCMIDLAPVRAPRSSVCTVDVGVSREWPPPGGLATREGWPAIRSNPSLANDALLAASCREHGFTLVTSDGDFDRFLPSLGRWRPVPPWPEIGKAAGR